MRALPMAVLLVTTAAVLPQVLATTSVTWNAPTQLGDALLGAEPSLTVANDGKVYMGTPGADVARSDDQGATWENIGTRHCLNLVSGSIQGQCPLSSTDPGLDGAGDTSLAVGADGTLYHLGLSGTGNVPFQSSTNNGTHFTTGVDLSPGHSADREWITMGPDGVLHASWRDTTDTDIKTRSSADKGVTWGPLVRAANDGHEGPIVADPTNGQRLYLPHVDGADLTVGVSTNGGSSWTQHKITKVYQDTSDFPVVAVDAAGTVYLVWNQDPTYKLHTTSVADAVTTIPQTLLSVSHDGGSTWSAPVGVSPAGVPSMFPWIAAGSAGKVAIVWYEGTAPVPSSRTANAWFVGTAISTDADTATPHFALSHTTSLPTHLGGICTWGLLCNLSGGDRSLLDFFQVGITPDGKAVIVYAGDSVAYQGYTAVYGVKMASGPNLLG